MNSFQCRGVYGSLDTPFRVFVHGGWYVIEGSVNVNRAPDGVWKYWSSASTVRVEGIEDVDTFTWSSPIESLDVLINAVDL